MHDMVSPAANPGFLAGGGEMGALMRAHDWSATPLGPAANWPQPLRSGISIMLGATSPMGIYWSADLTLFYNDAGRELIGDKHPQALGRPAREVFLEIWDTIGPMFAGIVAGAGGNVAREQLLPLDRYGRVEDAWFDYSFSPIPLQDGTVGGVLNLTFETTARVRAERVLLASEARQAFLLALGDRLRDLTDPREVMQAAAGLLGRHLSADRAGYAEVEDVGEFFTVERDWCAPGMPSLAGRHRLDDFGPALISEFRAGRSVAFEDALAGPLTPGEGAAVAYHRASTRAAITVPLVKAGHFAAALYVHAREPRRWTGEDEALVREAAERTWAAVERARAETALREREERQALLLRLVWGQRETSDPDAMMLAASEAVGCHLGANRVGFLDMLDDETLSFTVGWTDGSLDLLTGTFPAEGIGSAYLAAVRQGAVLGIADVQQDPLTAGSILAEIGARAIIRNGRWHAGIYVNHAAVRDWTKEEVELVREVADQTWDAVERARAEAALRELNETLETRVAARTAERNRLWSMTNLLVAVAAFDSTIREVNPAWPALLGWSEAELVGRSYAEFVYPDDVERSLAWAAKLAGGEEVVDLENRYRCKDGSYRCIAWAITADDSVFHCIGRDVTDQKLQADALAAAEDALRQAQKMEAVGQLTGGLAHDFNNMLQGIGGALNMVRRRVEQGRTEEASGYMEAAHKTVERAAALTHRLLAFARQQTLQPRAIEPNALVEGIADLVRRTVGPATTVELRLDDNAWSVLCDPNQLENVLLNLAINARDAMPEGGKLTIGTARKALDAADVAGQEGARPGDYVEISVADTGTGMDEAIRARAFEPFFTTKPLGQGTGLGLSQLYGFVRQSGGVVHLDSAPGRGTAVRLYLPRQDCAQEQETSSAPGEAEEAGAGGTVLLVEDEEGVRAMMVEHLRELGYAVLVAGDGPAALRLLRPGTRVDLLVTDVGLPGGMNGRQVADAARERRPGLPVLFITGYAGGALDGQFAPRMEVIGKPFALDALAAKVRTMLEVAPAA